MDSNRGDGHTKVVGSLASSTQRRGLVRLMGRATDDANRRSPHVKNLHVDARVSLERLNALACWHHPTHALHALVARQAFAQISAP